MKTYHYLNVKCDDLNLLVVSYLKTSKIKYIILIIIAHRSCKGVAQRSHRPHEFSFFVCENQSVYILLLIKVSFVQFDGIKRIKSWVLKPFVKCV